jgi:hypothetical protein
MDGDAVKQVYRRDAEDAEKRKRFFTAKIAKPNRPKILFQPM